MRGHEILADVARKHRLKVRDIIGGCRLAEVVKARHEAARRCREELDYSLHQVAAILKVHHTSVLYATSPDSRERKRSRYHAKRKARAEERT